MKVWAADAILHKPAALAYCDGLMIAIQASKPLRLRNLAGMRVGHSITRLSSNRYRLCFQPSETKTHALIQAELPESLTTYIDTWLRIVRPFLMGENQTDAMWINAQGTPMKYDMIYRRFCAATQSELRRRITPHMPRKIVATGVAIGAPELVNIIPSLLNHSDDRTAREAYNLAHRFRASDDLNRLMASRRQSAVRNIDSCDARSSATRKLGKTSGRGH